MYIKAEYDKIFEYWDYNIYTANHRKVLFSCNDWKNKSVCIRAAKKMARRLGIEYRENREVK